MGLNKVNILSKGLKVTNVFKSQEEYEKWSEEFYQKKNSIRKLSRGSKNLMKHGGKA
jgi:hypothetical protein